MPTVMRRRPLAASAQKTQRRGRGAEQLAAAAAAGVPCAYLSLRRQSTMVGKQRRGGANST